MKECLVIPSNKVTDFYGFSPGTGAIREDAVGFFLPRYENEAVEYDAKYQQLIPYCVIRRPDGAILTYRRPTKGDESRLHAKRSIGIGGHIEREDVPAGLDLDGAGLWVAIDAAALREILQEAGLRKPRLQQRGCIRHADTEVGSVHTGIVYIVESDGRVTTNDEIADPEWLSLEELHTIVIDDPGVLEHWSEIVVRQLYKATPQKPAPKAEPAYPGGMEPPPPIPNISAALGDILRGPGLLVHPDGTVTDIPPDALPQLDERGMEVAGSFSAEVAPSRTDTLPSVEPSSTMQQPEATLAEVSLQQDDGPDFSDSPAQMRERGADSNVTDTIIDDPKE